MKDELIQSLSVVLNALDNIEVKGKANLANLSGSIAMIENVISALGSVEIDKKGAELAGDTEEE
ncbi:hypothetical protein [Pseudobutyrivibrio sp.]|uniref:hypothetical protein n=1 Tax=Pseudobutyrivibrio sp. TaxID=2014367 RepID=UPI0025CC95D9|nr:hypothetical protein [Pseudobutyrivibrio sp.]